MLQSSFHGQRFGGTQLVGRSPVGRNVAPLPPRAAARGGAEATTPEHAGLSTHATPAAPGSSEVRRRQFALNNRLVSLSHPNTVDLSTTAVDAPPAGAHSQLPVSQLAFKALLRASLAAARLGHGCVTTPHLMLGLLSATQPPAHDTPGTAPAAAAGSSSHPLAGGSYPAAESAVSALIDGAAAASSAAAAAVGAAGALLGRSWGLDAVAWCGEISLPAHAVLREAEQLRQQQGQPLLTTCHILSALLASSPDQQQQRAEQLLRQAGLDPAAVAAEAAAAVAAGRQQGEDGQQCEPVGWLHEEFATNLHRALMSPAAPGSSICLN